MALPLLFFSGLYFPQSRQDLLIHRRINVPELTDEDPNEPAIQLQDSFALGIHFNNVLLDHVGQETLMPTTRLRESLRAQLLLIGRELDEDVPAIADLLFTLGAALTLDTTIPAPIVAATEATDTTPAISFETTAAVALSKSDEVTQAWEDDGGVFTDRTTEANGTGTFTPWGGAPLAGDALYIGHDSVLWDQINYEFTGVFSAELLFEGFRVWEYFDGNLSVTNPTDVDELTGIIEINVNSLLGSAATRAGTIVRVRSNVTGVFEDVVSVFAAMTAGGPAVNKITTTTLLGQTSPVSTLLSDYVIGSDFIELAGITESTAAQGSPIEVSFDLPQKVTRNWRQTTINGVKAFYIRLRIITDFVGAGPTFGEITTDDDTQFFVAVGTQGETASDDPIGLSNGLADQRFTTTQEDVIQASLRAFVDEGAGNVEYTEVQDFLSSNQNSRDFTLEFDVDGRGIVTFGNGTAARIPPLNAPIKLDYRIGASEDGNVGADTITVNQGSTALVAAVTNPRPATGWVAAEGSTEESLAALKISGPASLRTLDRALTLDDIETLALEFKDSSGSEPIERALAVEEKFGDKTIGLVVVGVGGVAIPDETLTNVDTFFNGDPVLGTPGVLVINHQVTTENAALTTVNVTVDITGGDAAVVKAAIEAFLQPLAKTSTGEFEHGFGVDIALSRIVTVAHKADSDVTKVVVTVPGADISIPPESLPTPGTVLVI